MNVQKNIGNLVAAFFVIFALMIFCHLSRYSLIIPLFLFILGVHLHYYQKASWKLYLNLGLLLTITVFIAHATLQYSTISYFYIPVAGIAMLTTLLFNDLLLAFMMVFASSVLVSLIVGGGFGVMLTFFIGGLVGSYSVRESRTRGQLMSAGLFVSVTHLLCLFLLNPNANFFISQKDFALQQLYPLIANGFICVVFVSGTLKVFEYLFGVLTNYSLLELSDFNQPLLKRMILEAPGTYHHSLVVSNLAEAASDAIGANALLTRVGAYYHDIGKMVKPEYFTENQLLGGGNKHDNIEPTMSRLVILNHVKEGIELAKKNKLNQEIINFIPQHHGTGLIHYFHQKAIEVAEDGEVVDESNFRYPGPKPQIRETAIVLLADSVEGAVRALDDPNPTKIEETVKKIINNKFIDAQLDECNLTLKEIEKISSTFTRILSAMYHGRIKYPEKKNANINRKSSEKNPSQSSSNQKDHQTDSPL